MSPHPDPHAAASLLAVALAALCASAVNAAAGGGSFISFPALLGVGMAPIPANATNNFAMWLGSMTSAGQFRDHLAIERPALIKILVVSLIGSLVGALILLRISNATFGALIPWLLLGATLLYVGGPWLTRRAQTLEFATATSPLGLTAQFVVGVYGGFFGAAQGILMLALFGVLGFHDPRHANALKNVLATAINGIACVPYILAGAIDWPTGCAMGAGAMLGGYAGAKAVKRLPGPAVRRLVITIASGMTVFFFWRTYAG